MARQRLTASLRVLDVAVMAVNVNVDDNARKMMEFPSTNVIATNIATAAGAQQGNKELEAAIDIDDKCQTDDRFRNNECPASKSSLGVLQDYQVGDNNKLQQ